MQKAWVGGSPGGTSQIRHQIDTGHSPFSGAQQSIVLGPSGAILGGSVCVRIFPGIEFLKGRKYWGGINTNK